MTDEDLDQMLELTKFVRDEPNSEVALKVARMVLQRVPELVARHKALGSRDELEKLLDEAQTTGAKKMQTKCVAHCKQAEEQHLALAQKLKNDNTIQSFETRASEAYHLGADIKQLSARQVVESA